MSRRAMVFKAANIMPQVTCNYTVWIPSIWRSPLAIETTSLPFKKTTSASIHIRGVEYKIPVKNTAQGQWQCTMVENLFMGSLYQALNKWNIDLSSNLGSTEYISSFKFGKIYIFVTDALTSSAPVAMCVLDDCYLTEIKDLSLDTKGATDVVKIQLTFQYNGIIDPISSAENIFGVGLDDGGIDSVAAIEAGVAGITAAAWGLAWGGNKAMESIESMLDNG